MLNEIMSERGMNTLSEEARDDAMKMYAERAYKKGQISEDEYREIMGFKVGGRVAYKDGTSEMGMMDPKKIKQAEQMIGMGMDFSTISSITGLSEDTIEQLMKTEKKAEGGIMGVRNNYAMGSEVPIRENQAGIREMDFRQTGGFVPPIGVKEKADDIPAMLSNNEFVFTADAVRAAGGGSVNKGAKRMYDLMKSLEGKVV
jgi:hypothetical protein